jgi:type I restriction enzyme S subunit
MKNKLPKDWKIVNMGDVFTIERGGSPRPIEEYITDKSNGINWIKIGDTKGITKYIKNTKEKIKPDGLKKSRMVFENDFILSNSMSFGRPYIMKTTGCIHDGWLVIRKNETINNDYLYLVLTSNQVYIQFCNLAKGSTVKNLNIEAVKKVIIPLPPLQTQQAIVSKIEELFSALDKGIEDLKTAQQQLKTYRQSVLKWAFEGKLSPLTPKGGTKEGWEKLKIKDICEIKGGKNQSKVINPNGQYPIYGSSGIFGYADEYICDENTTIVGRKGNINSPLFVTTKFWNVDTAFGLCVNERYNSKLLFYFCLGFNFKKLDKSTTIPSLAKSDILSIDIPVPPLEQQHLIVQEIESRLSVADKMAESIVHSLQQAEALRQSILKKAFSGELV